MKNTILLVTSICALSSNISAREQTPNGKLLCGISVSPIHAELNVTRMSDLAEVSIDLTAHTNKDLNLRGTVYSSLTNKPLDGVDQTFGRMAGDEEKLSFRWTLNNAVSEPIKVILDFEDGHNHGQLVLREEPEASASLKLAAPKKISTTKLGGLAINQAIALTPTRKN